MPPHDAAPTLDIPSTEPIELADLLARVQQCADQGLRFITATCLDLGGTYELNYHFDKDLSMLHLRTMAPKSTPVPSISGIYLGAFLIENEMKELLGVDITNIAIDYQGHLYLTEDSAPTPMARPVAEDTTLAKKAQGNGHAP